MALIRLTITFFWLMAIAPFESRSIMSQHLGGQAHCHNEKKASPNCLW
jgi:hypothetical protein